MKEKDLHELIRKNSSYDNKSLANALKQQHPEIFQNSNTSKGVLSKKPIIKRIAIFAPLVTAAVLAVVLIPTLLLDNGTSETPGNEYNPPPPIRYAISELDCTVQDYNKLYNTRFLYFNWPETTDYVVVKYNSIDNKEFLGLEVNLKNPETNDYIEYVVSSDTETLNFLKQNILICNNESTIMNKSIKWVTQNNNSYGIFDYDGYGYYVTLKDNPNETRLFELIEELLLSQE